MRDVLSVPSDSRYAAQRDAVRPPGTLRTQLDMDALNGLLKDDAEKQAMKKLHDDFYGNLQDDDKLNAIAKMLGKEVGQIKMMTAAAVKTKMSGWAGRWVRWDDLAAQLRVVKGRAPDHTATDGLDYAGYGELVLMGAAGLEGVVGGLAEGVVDPITGVTSNMATTSFALDSIGAGIGVKGIAPDSLTIGLDGAQVAADWTALMSNELAIPGGALTVGEALRDGSGGNLHTRAEVLTKVLGGVGDSSVSASKTAAAAIHMGLAGSHALAVMAVGGAAAAAGIAYTIHGVHGALVHSRRKAELTVIEAEQSQRSETGTSNGDAAHFALAARMGVGAERTKARAALGTAAKGAIMVAGGALVIACASNPVGWTLLTGAALIATLVAVRKYLNTKSARNAVIDHELKIDDDEGVSEPRYMRREKALQRKGFASATAFHQDLVDGMAKRLHGILSQEPETEPKTESYTLAKTIVANLGLKVDARRVPTVAQIGKRLAG